MVMSNVLIMNMTIVSMLILFNLNSLALPIDGVAFKNVVFVSLDSLDAVVHDSEIEKWRLFSNL